MSFGGYITSGLLRSACGECRSQSNKLHGTAQCFEKVKKTFDYKTIENLNQWKKETQMVFGPTVKVTHPGSKSIKKTNKKSDAGDLDTLKSSMSSTLTGQDHNIASKKTVKPKVSWKKSTAVPNRGSWTQDVTHAKYEDNLDIPKISPIPAHKENGSFSQINQTERLSDAVKESPTQTLKSHGKKKASISTRTSQSISVKSKLAAGDNSVDEQFPSSFDLIKLFPFMVNEKEAFQLGSFKSDVEQLAFRAPPSVKSILSKTMPDLSRFFLNRWREKMLAELGEEGFKQLQHENIRKGINLHANVMEFLSGKPVKELQIMPENEGHWSSLEPVLEDVQGVKAVELEVLHPQLAYRGVFDCVAVYKDVLCLIDWKTSKQPRPLLKNTYDDPLQIAAYLGAFNSSEQCRASVSSGQVQHGVIVVAYPDGSPAHIHWMDRALCKDYWAQWTLRLTSFYQMIYAERLPGLRHS